MPRQIILVHPEDAPASLATALAAPVYAETVGRSRQGTIQVRTLPGSTDVASTEFRLPCDMVERLRVLTSELSGGAPGLLIRRPVCVLDRGATIYGQAVDYHNDVVTVRHSTGTVEVPLSCLTEVAPVIAFLLCHEPPRTDLDEDELLRNHSTILEHLLGGAGTAATRSIPKLLAGIVPVARQPRRAITIAWICPHTGTECQASVGHIVDIGFFSDGSRSLPRTVRIGGSFCDDPSLSTATVVTPVTGSSSPRVRLSRHEAANIRPRISVPPVDRSTRSGVSSQPVSAALNIDSNASNARPVNRVAWQANPRVPEDHATAQSEGNQRFLDLLDTINDDPSSDEEISRDDDGITGAKRTRSRHQSVNDRASSVSASILALLADYPDLARDYAAQLRQLAATKRPRYDSVSDFVNQDDSGDPKDSFRPTGPQKTIHRAITSYDHRGKDPMSFVDCVRASKATKFLPLPVILSHLYDFQFGAYGLSVLHFYQLNQPGVDPQGASMHNFSTATRLPKLADSFTLSNLIDALRIQNRYGTEFFDMDTLRLVTEASDFAMELRDFEPLSSVEVIAIARWFSSVLGEFRAATEFDLNHGTVTRRRIRDRLAMQDAELNTTLLRASRLRSNIPYGDHHPPRHGAPRDNDRGRESDRGSRYAPTGSRPQFKLSVPPQIARSAPRQGGKSLCLRFISARGCPSQSADQCTQSYLGHFVPAVLDLAVRTYVGDSLGGLRPDLRHL